MELRFRPRFYRDLSLLKGKKEISAAVYRVIRQVEEAKNISEINGLKKLVAYEVYYRIRLNISERDNYRIGLSIRGNKVWFDRILPRRKFYKHFP